MAIILDTAGDPAVTRQTIRLADGRVGYRELRGDRIAGVVITRESDGTPCRRYFADPIASNGPAYRYAFGLGASPDIRPLSELDGLGVETLKDFYRIRAYRRDRNGLLCGDTAYYYPSSGLFAGRRDASDRLARTDRECELWGWDFFRGRIYTAPSGAEIILDADKCDAVGC